MPVIDGAERQDIEKPDSSGDKSADSSVDYSKIDWSKVDWSKVPVDALPEEVIKETPTAKKLLEETIQRRQTIKQMKEALGEKPAEQPQQPTKPQPVDDVPEWAKSLMSEVKSIVNETSAQRTQRAIDEAMTANGLPKDAISFLEGLPLDQIPAKAASLGKLLVPQDNTAAGNAGGKQGDLQSRAMQIIQDRINGSKPVGDKGGSIFDATIQTIK